MVLLDSGLFCCRSTGQFFIYFLILLSVVYGNDRLRGWITARIINPIFYGCGERRARVTTVQIHPHPHSRLLARPIIREERKKNAGVGPAVGRRYIRSDVYLFYTRLDAI